MKIVKQYSLILGITLGTLATTGSFSHQNTTPQTHKYPTLKETYDTIYVSNTKTKYTGGQFIPGTNTVRICYFLPANINNKTLINYCDKLNQAIPATLIHEREHARKAFITKNTNHFSPLNRARIAAHNEMMAPAAEIIGIVEQCIAQGKTHTQNKAFINKAAREIFKIIKNENLQFPIDFNNPRIADVILQHAFNRFINRLANNQYHTTIREAYLHNTQPPYTPTNACTNVTPSLFNPTLGIWDQMWDFDTHNGHANIWRSASPDTKSYILTELDKHIIKITGQNAYFLTKDKVH